MKVDGEATSAATIKSGFTVIESVVECESPTVPPDTMIVYVAGPSVEAVVESVRTEVDELPGPNVTNAGLRDAASPTAPEGIVTLRFTAPDKPKLTIVSVDTDEPPAMKLPGDGGLTVKTKSALTMNEMVAFCARLPLLPVMVTAYVPDGVDAVVPIARTAPAVAPGVSVTLVVLKENVKPDTIGVESVTVPLKP